ncbi:MAG TPA: hypothetical protein VFQ05_03610 [Candidatus Eisenbacteria bacterium]|nr:hypothetical protein [Candidatus Eisenbacteria bacterium]
MKKPVFGMLAAVLLMAGLASVVPVTSGADSLESEIELLRSDLKTGKMELVKEAIHVEGAKADAFWPVYRTYQAELDKIGDQRLALIKDYAENFDKMTDEKAKTLVKSALDLQKKRVDLLQKHYKNFEKVLGPTDAARLVQVEHLIAALMDVQVGANLPLMEKSAATTTKQE